MSSLHSRLGALTLGVTLFGSGCSKKPEPVPPAPPQTAPAAAAFHVTSIDLGTSIAPDKSIAGSTSSFTPRDTVYVSVATDGTTPSAAVKARVTFENGQLVDEMTQTIAPSGPAHTEFHLVKPSGWPVGKYKVEITVDGAVAGTKDYEVKKA